MSSLPGRESFHASLPCLSPIINTYDFFYLEGHHVGTQTEPMLFLSHPSSPSPLTCLPSAPSPHHITSAQGQVAGSPSIKRLSRHGDRKSKQAKIMTQLSARIWLNDSGGGNASFWGGGWVITSLLNVSLFVAA